MQVHSISISSPVWGAGSVINSNNTKKKNLTNQNLFHSHVAEAGVQRWIWGGASIEIGCMMEPGRFPGYQTGVRFYWPVHCIAGIKRDFFFFLD